MSARGWRRGEKEREIERERKNEEREREREEWENDPIYLSICLPAYLCVYLRIYLSIYLFVLLHASFYPCLCIYLLCQLPISHSLFDLPFPCGLLLFLFGLSIGWLVFFSAGSLLSHFLSYHLCTFSCSASSVVCITRLSVSRTRTLFHVKRQRQLPSSRIHRRGVRTHRGSVASLPQTPPSLPLSR